MATRRMKRAASAPRSTAAAKVTAPVTPSVDTTPVVETAAVDVPPVEVPAIVAPVAPVAQATAEAVASLNSTAVEAVDAVVSETTKTVPKVTATKIAAPKVAKSKSVTPVKAKPTVVSAVMKLAKTALKPAKATHVVTDAKKIVAKTKAAAKPAPPKTIKSKTVIQKTTPRTAPAKVADTVSKGPMIMATTFDSMTAKPAAMLGEMNERTKVAMEKSSKMVEDMTDFAKGNVEAIVEAGRIATKGAEEIAKYTAEYGRTSIEKANSTAKQFAGVKSPTEFFKMQGDYTKQLLDSMVAESSKFTESYMKLLGEIAQPISNRVAVAAEKVKIAA